MSDETTVTEREARLRERRAFKVGWRSCENGSPNQESATDLERWARHLYPIETKRRRVVRDRYGCAFKLESIPPFRILWRTDGDTGEAWTVDLPPATEDRVRIWASLVDNPDEEVSE